VAEVSTLANIQFVTNALATEADKPVQQQPTDFLHAQLAFAQRRPACRWAPRSPAAPSQKPINAEWISAHRDVIAWIYSHLPSNNFAVSLSGQYEEKGTLSKGQVEAVRAIIAGQPSPSRAAAAPDVSGSGYTRLLDAFKAARATGLKAPALKFKEFVFSYAKENSKNPGHVYVKLGGNYKGKITPEGRFFAVGGTTREETAEVMRVGRDPLAAAIEHGRLTGRCAVCSRVLDNPESVQRGIGPICAKKFGW